VKLLAAIVPIAIVGAAVGIAAPAGAAVAGPRIATAPASISSDCSRDVSAELTAWIASVPDHSTLEFAPQGCYRVDRTLTIRYRNDLVLEGNGATFRAFTTGRELPPAQARTRSMFSFWKGSNLTLRDVIVRGANPNAGVADNAYVPALEAQTAYVIGGVQGMVLDHVQAYDVYGDFVFVGPATNHLLVENSTFARNGRQGWTINGQDIVFRNNAIRMTRRATIDLEPSSATSVTRRVTISNNTIGVGRLYFLANEGRAAPTDDISILNNMFVNKAMTIWVNPPAGTRARYRVIGNTSDTAVGTGGGGAMTFNHVLGVEVRNNVQPMQRGRGISGVYAKNSRDVSVTGNQFPYAKTAVISNGASFNVSQSGNSVGNPLHAVPASTFAGPG
jgi:hypothetical protein